MRTTCATWLVACLTILGCVSAAHADSYSKAVQKSCAADYHKYCGAYGLESGALRVCMDKVGNSLSKARVKALIQSGEVSEAEADAASATSAYDPRPGPFVPGIRHAAMRHASYQAPCLGRRAAGLPRKMAVRPV